MNSTEPKPKRWIHPQHGRGVKSQNFDHGVVKGQLTNSQIERYMREGRYGLRAQQKILAADKRKAKKKQPIAKKVDSLFAELGI